MLNGLFLAIQLPLWIPIVLQAISERAWTRGHVLDIGIGTAVAAVAILSPLLAVVALWQRAADSTVLSILKVRGVLLVPSAVAAATIWTWPEALSARVSCENVRSLHVGDSTAMVRNLLGDPFTFARGAEIGRAETVEQWGFARVGSNARFYISFDDDRLERVIAYRYVGLDGAVVLFSLTKGERCEGDEFARFFRCPEATK